MTSFYLLLHVICRETSYHKFKVPWEKTVCLNILNWFITSLMTAKYLLLQSCEANHIFTHFWSLESIEHTFWCITAG